MKTCLLFSAICLMGLPPLALAQPGKEKKETQAVRVLLFADAPTREYHFVRDTILRQKERYDVAIHLQGATLESDQYVEPERMLEAFPALKPGMKQHDLILAFDPDWAALGAAKLQALHHWVHDQGGGLILIAGPVNSIRLARPGGHDLSALLAMIPVRLLDARLHGSGLDAGKPHALRIHDGAGDLVKLSEDKAWGHFHGVDAQMAHARPKRGFYSAVPTGSVQPRAQVAASLVDPNGRERPFLVTMPFGKGRVVFVASGELWRLRAFNQDYHTQLWWNLAQHATRRLDIQLASELYVPHQIVEDDSPFIEAMLVDDKGAILPKTAKPKLHVTPPPGSKLEAITLTMTPRRPAAHDGTFVAQLKIGAPGLYVLELTEGTGKVRASRKVDVKSYQMAHFEYRIYFLRQQDLSRRTLDSARMLVALATQMADDADEAFAKEGQTYRDAFEAAQKEGLLLRQEKLAKALAQAKNLRDFQALLEESRELESKLRLVRTPILAKLPPAPAELAELAHLEEGLAMQRDLVMESLDTLFRLVDFKPSDDEARAHAKRIETALKSLQTYRALLREDQRRYDEKLGAAKSPVRPETARYLKTRYAMPFARLLDEDLVSVEKLVVRLGESYAAGKGDASLATEVRRKLQKAIRELDARNAPKVGAMLFEMLRLEAEQARQSHVLAQIKSRMEADLLNELLKTK